MSARAGSAHTGFGPGGKGAVALSLVALPVPLSLTWPGWWPAEGPGVVLLAGGAAARLVELETEGAGASCLPGDALCRQPARAMMNSTARTARNRSSPASCFLCFIEPARPSPRGEKGRREGGKKGGKGSSWGLEGHRHGPLDRRGADGDVQGQGAGAMAGGRHGDRAAVGLGNRHAAD